MWMSYWGLVALVAAGTVALGVSNGWTESTSLGVAGILISVAGFALAVMQLHRVRAASEQARSAVEAVLGELRGLQLTAAVTAMRYELAPMDAAVRASDFAALLPALVKWREVGLSCKVLLPATAVGEEAIAAIDRARAAAQDAKKALYEDVPDPRVLQAAVEQVEFACDQAFEATQNGTLVAEEQTDE